MITYFKPPATDKAARTQQGIVDRARTLFANGYTYTRLAGQRYRIVGPETGAYIVDRDAGNCSCESYTYHSDCKHRLGLEIELFVTTINRHPRP